MFLGSYTPSFDPNLRRIALPKKIRESLATGEVILSYGFEKCIFGFDKKAWAKESQVQLNEPLTDPIKRDIRRFFFSTAITVGIDIQGRIVIPNNLLEYAQINKPIIIGAGDHFEIWEQTAWHKELKRLEEVNK